MTSTLSAGPRISVVIPSYQHEQYLPEAIDSVLTQAGVTLELVIIDDGSRDNSWAVIQQAAGADERVRAYRQTNQGAHAAINAGIQASRGEFIAILNSDDRYCPDRLATLLALCEHKAGLDFVATGMRLIDAQSQPLTDDPWLLEYARMRETAQRSGLWVALLARNVTVSTSNFFFRRSLYDALGAIRPLRYNMDWDYALRAYTHDPARFMWASEHVLFDYRLHGANTILDGLPESAIEANYLLYRSLKQHYGVPGPALASLRRYARLIRKQQVTSVASERDETWEARLQEAHAGWAATSDAYDAVHNQLGETLTELGQTRTELGHARNVGESLQSQLAATRDAHDAVHDQLGKALTELGQTRTELAHARNVGENLQSRLGETLTELEHTRSVVASLQGQLQDVHDELAAIRASRSYRIGRALTAPVRRLKALRHNAGTTAPEPVYRPIALPAPLIDPLPRVAVHIHLHYTSLLDELLDAAANVPSPFDLYITTTQPVATLQPAVQQRFPDAQLWQCPNQGKDVGPFIDALLRYRLDAYDLVLKLHSKKSQNSANYVAAIQGLFGKDLTGGEDWRRGLIAPIAGSEERVRQIYQAFAQQPHLGMVGAARFICRAPDADASGYDRLCQRLGVPNHTLFFGGTMFWIRGSVLARIREAGFSLDDFNPAQHGAVESTLEHGFERVFGTLVASTGLELGGVSGD